MPTERKAVLCATAHPMQTGTALLPDRYPARPPEPLWPSEGANGPWAQDDSGADPDAVAGAGAAHTLAEDDDPEYSAFVDGRPAAPAVAGGPLVSLLGSTGFLAAHTVVALLQAGWRVRVLTHEVHQLPPVFFEPGVERVRGDADHPHDLARAIDGADAVVHLAPHGSDADLHSGGAADGASPARRNGGPDTDTDTDTDLGLDPAHAAWVERAWRVAQVCQRCGVQRLVHVGSIDSLYLGEAGVRVGAHAPPDPQPEARSPGARAHAVTERRLFDLHRQTGLPLVLLRAGLLVGAGGAPFHDGLGRFGPGQRCTGWNDGRHPLPWLLASDCAQAISAALVSPSAVGKAYNLAGDVRWSAREYLDQLAHALQRPWRFHPSSPRRQWLGAFARSRFGRLGGGALPSRHELMARGLLASLDCSDARRDLQWTPMADPAEFHRLAVQVHAEGVQSWEAWKDEVPALPPLEPAPAHSTHRYAHGVPA
jgi:nucleoside-diphosphate-sugar epimerase